MDGLVPKREELAQRLGGEVVDCALLLQVLANPVANVPRPPTLRRQLVRREVERSEDSKLLGLDGEGR